MDDEIRLWIFKKPNRMVKLDFRLKRLDYHTVNTSFITINFNLIMQMP